MVTYQTGQTRREKKLAVKRMFLSSSFRGGIMAFVAVFGILYVLQTTAVSTKGYIISDLERQVHELKQETRLLDVEIAKNSSMQSIQARLVGKDLVQIAKIEYLNPVGTSVAVR